MLLKDCLLVSLQWHLVYYLGTILYNQLICLKLTVLIILVWKHSSVHFETFINIQIFTGYKIIVFFMSTQSAPYLNTHKSILCLWNIETLTSTWQHFSSNFAWICNQVWIHLLRIFTSRLIPCLAVVKSWHI